MGPYAGDIDSGGVFKQLGYDIMAAAFEVHRELGSGFLEEVYEECLELELLARNIAFVTKPELQIRYQDCPLRKRYQPDFLVAGEVIIELKALRALAPEHDAQVLNYLKVTRRRVGYLINFSAQPKLQWKRFIL